ncbi:MAG: hypothetical protein MNPFHGCM_02082 [Gemmatimonadaceae bacterium]|nr:hypothetical protein [Gemmatimonadaceae bacterium]
MTSDPNSVVVSKIVPESGSDLLNWSGMFRLIPRWVWLIGTIAALMHMTPFWHAKWSARGDWSFTGNLTISPDYMQYRVWERQTRREGPIVSNRFTTEPNSRHLPVFYYWAVGGLARATGVSPEAAYAYSGALLAVALVLLLYGVVRAFLPDPSHHVWTLVALVFGGGLGAYLKVMSALPVIGASSIVTGLVSGPLESWPVFEDYRSHYIVHTLYDSHFLLLWVVCVAAVAALYLSIRRWTPARAVAAAGLFAVATVLHVYEGVTLVAIAIGVAIALRHDGPEGQNARRAAWLTAAAVAVCYAALGLLYRSSGLPFPPWRAINILAATLAIAFPASWALIAIGGARYFREGGVPARFIIGWAMACTVVTLSGPFFPYPDRGTMTLQVPLTIAAVAIFFARWGRMTAKAAIVAVVLLGATPARLVARSWYYTGFRSDAPFMLINGDHRTTLKALRQAADTNDILLAEPRDLLWLAPDFPGRLYVGHFFLTVDYRAKNEALTRAIQSPDSMPALLSRSGSSLLFVNADRDAARFSALPDLSVVSATKVGTLFRVRDVRR